MSGTSLDGLDIALCEFDFDNRWNYSIIFAKTYDYNDQWLDNFKNIEQFSSREFMKLHAELGTYFGDKVNQFIAEHKIDRTSIDAIASHGQTIFHQPEDGFTTQIGSGAHLAAKCGIKTICDFRSLDVAFGGQGAPLVPIGDELLFGEYDYCLNFGGIANVSFNENGFRKSLDIGFANMASNYLCEKLGKTYDENGQIAEAGNFDHDLFEQLNSLEYFQKLPPKSLGKEYFDQVFSFTLNNNPLSTEDQLHTFGIHLAFQVSKWIKNGRCLTTGGGTYNSFWIKEIQRITSTELIIPEPLIINFKEALIFAFLGLLRLRHETNTLQSVTGARRDSIGGCIYLG